MILRIQNKQGRGLGCRAFPRSGWIVPHEQHRPSMTSDPTSSTMGGCLQRMHIGCAVPRA